MHDPRCSAKCPCSSGRIVPIEMSGCTTTCFATAGKEKDFRGVITKNKKAAPPSAKRRRDILAGFGGEHKSFCMVDPFKFLNVSRHQRDPYDGLKFDSDFHLHDARRVALRAHPAEISIVDIGPNATKAHGVENIEGIGPNCY